MRTECRSNHYYATFLSALIAGVLVLGGCSNPEKAKMAHLEKGEAYLKDAKYQEASIEFRNAIQIDDGLAAAHWGLSKAYEELSRLPESFEELKRTVQLDPKNLEAKAKLGNIYLAGVRQNPKELLPEAERLAKEILQQDPNFVEGHILMGSVLFAQSNEDQSKVEKALGELNKAIDLDPKRVESYLSLARFYIVTRDPGKADETFKRAISLNDNSALAHTEYGKYLVQLGKQPEAQAELQKAVAVEPNNKTSRFVLSSFYLVTKQMDKAEESYKTLSQIDKDKPESQAVLADFYSLAGRPADAIKIYQGIVTNSPDFLQGRYRLSEIMMMSGDRQGASAQIEELLKRDQHDRQALLLRARLRSRTGQNSELKAAVEDLKEVLRQEPNSRAGLYFMAQANFGLGLIDQARTFTGELEKNYPDYLPAKLLQIQISLAAADPKSAVRLSTDLLDRLSKTAPDKDNTPQLMTEIRAKTYLTRGAAQVQMKNFPSARNDFMAGREIAPNDPDVYNNLAVLSIQENKPDEAVAFFENTLSNDATNFTALSGLITIYSNKLQFSQAHARIDRVLSTYPNVASLHFLKAQIYGFEHNGQGAETELNKTLELDANYVQAYYALAALFINSKQEDRAIAEYRKLLERRPDNTGAYTLIGMLEDGRKNYDGAIENYRKALELDQNSAIAGNNLAWIYGVYGKGNPDEAVRLAQGVVQKNPNVPGFLDTLGWIYYKKGLYAAAAEQLQTAVDLDAAAAKKVNGDPSAMYQYHLGMALKARGDREGARRQLEAALRVQDRLPSDDADEARRALATL